MKINKKTINIPIIAMIMAALVLVGIVMAAAHRFDRVIYVIGKTGNRFRRNVAGLEREFEEKEVKHG